MIDLSSLPPWARCAIDAAATTLQVAAFFAFLWGVWFIAWVLG